MAGVTNRALTLATAGILTGVALSVATLGVVDVPLKAGRALNLASASYTHNNVTNRAHNGVLESGQPIPDTDLIGRALTLAQLGSASAYPITHATLGLIETTGLILVPPPAVTPDTGGTTGSRYALRKKVRAKKLSDKVKVDLVQPEDVVYEAPAFEYTAALYLEVGAGVEVALQDVEVVSPVLGLLALDVTARADAFVEGLPAPVIFAGALRLEVKGTGLVHSAVQPLPEELSEEDMLVLLLTQMLAEDT